MRKPRPPVVDLSAVEAIRAELRQIVKSNPELRPVPEEDLENIMARETNDAQIVVRLPQALVDRIDAYAERLQEDEPGPAWRRSDVVRKLIAKAIDDVETSKKPRRR